MTELRERLDDIAGSVRPPTAAEVDADIARGRRALRRRNSGRIAAGSALGVAMLTAFSVLAAHTGAAPPGSTPPGLTPPGQTSPGPTGQQHRPTVVALKLVAYQGPQPKGYTLDKVPAGWFIQADTRSYLLLAPRISPSLAPPTDRRDETRIFVGKIVIMLESTDQHGPSRPGTTVHVRGRKGTLLKSRNDDHPNGDNGWEVWVRQPSGSYLIVQFFAGLHLSKAQMIELAAGVHVHKGAQQSHG